MWLELNASELVTAEASHHGETYDLALEHEAAVLLRLDELSRSFAEAKHAEEEAVDAEVAPWDQSELLCTSTTCRH